MPAAFSATTSSTCSCGCSSRNRPERAGGFVHVPLLPEQALDTSAPIMALETLVQAARIVVRASLS